MNRIALLLLLLMASPLSFGQDKNLEKARKKLAEARPEDREEMKFLLAAEYYSYNRQSYDKYRKRMAAEHTAENAEIAKVLQLFEMKKEKKFAEGIPLADKLIAGKKASPWALKAAYGYKSDFIAQLKGPAEANRPLYEALKRLRPYKKPKYLADIYNKIGINLFNLGKYDEALKSFEYSAGLTPAHDKENKGGRMMNVGVLYYRSGKTEKSLTYYEYALKSLGRDPSEAKGNAFVNMGISLEHLNRSDEALKSYESAHSIFTQVKDTNGIILSLEQKAQALKSLGRPDEALPLLLQSVRYHKQRNSTEQLTSTYTRLATYALEIKDTASAMSYIMLSHRSALASKSFPTIVSNYEDLAVFYVEINKPSKALEYFRKAEAMVNEAGGNPQILGGTYLGMGNAYKKMGDFRKAIQYYEKSLAINAQLEDPRMVAGLYSNIGVACFDLGQYDKALENYKKALEIRRSLGIGKDIFESYQTFANVYEQKGDYRNAFLYYKKFIGLRDSLQDKETADRLMEMQTAFKTEQIQDSLTIDRQKLRASKANEKLAKARNSRNFFIILGMALVLALVAGLSLIIARNSRMRKAANLELTRKNTEIEAQKSIIEQKNKDILDSISYAKRLQEAILPPAKLVQSWMPKSFILYKPKDIVAGDFYWMETVDSKDGRIILYAAADCTGHGVPGAMISVVCSNALNRAVKEFGIYEPAKVLDKVNELVIETFEKSETTVSDGMDISLCAWNLDRNELQWAGANNPLWIFRGNGIIEVKGDKQPIGPYDHRKPFTNHIIALQPEDTIYNFSDGFADQFGGPNGKKLKSSRLRELLGRLQPLDMEQQRLKLNEEFEKWRGDIEQIDDVCVIGIRSDHFRTSSTIPVSSNCSSAFETAVML
jgi:tetratricopeptide (TPR) repeat protein